MKAVATLLCLVVWAVLVMDLEAAAVEQVGAVEMDRAVAQDDPQQPDMDAEGTHHWKYNSFYDPRSYYHYPGSYYLQPYYHGNYYYYY